MQAPVAAYPGTSTRVSNVCIGRTGVCVTEPVYAASPRVDQHTVLLGVHRLTREARCHLNLQTERVSSLRAFVSRQPACTLSSTYHAYLWR